MRLKIGHLPLKSECIDAQVVPLELLEAVSENVFKKKKSFIMAYHKNLAHL